MKTRLNCFGFDHPAVLLLASLLLCLAGLPGVAQEASSTNAALPGVPLKVLNREVMTFRANLGAYSPEQRAAAAAVRIENAVRQPSEVRVDSRLTASNAELRVHGQTVFFIQPADVDELAGETLETVRLQTERRLALAIKELEELRDYQGLIKSTALGVAATLGIVGFIWLLARNRRWLEGRLIRLTADKADQIKSHSLRTLGLQNLVGVLRGLMTTIFWATTLVAGFLWLEFLLRLFPTTRPFGEQLEAKFLLALGALGQGALHALPDLGIVIVVLALARFAHTAMRRFFLAVARGNIKSRFFDPTTAPIAQRLVIILIWVTAIIVAFPYIPGSQTPAFRGITVLTGLMISLGSGNLIAQLVGGLTMVYSRTCRPGDFVKIGELEGTIASVGFFSSRLVTGRNEEIILPNSQLFGGTLVNYTRLNESSGVLVPTTVTIGYNTPWRQVHALLIEAARRTPGLKPQPHPTVLQQQLSDFYIEYELRVALEKPAERRGVLSKLHANILDLFNEYGVQIMSPHYEADPPQPVVVPKSKWHEPPAAAPLA